MYRHTHPLRAAHALVPSRIVAGVVVAMSMLSGACDSSSNNLTSAPSSRSVAVVPTGPSFSVDAALPGGFSLGKAAKFAALGGAGVTCTAPIPALPKVTIRGGNVGSVLLAPSSVTGFPGFTPGANPCSLAARKTIKLGATAAFADFQTAYNALRDIPIPTDAAHLLSGDLGGKTLAPGVYYISGTVLLTSKLTLKGPAKGIWIFKTASDLTPIGGSVVMAGNGDACNVYWEIGTAASLNATQFVGNMLAGTAITFTGVGSSLAGRALAATDVTMTGADIRACGSSKP
ncbi:MAG TPA: ice-binding family protein [Gemmatimonadaceae bacterium]